MDFTSFKHYNRKDIQEAMLKTAKKREIAGVFSNGSYSSRPDVLINGRDIIAMTKKGVIEFHCSIERWRNAMSIRPDNYNEIREGWDIILDLDCKNTEYGKEAAKALRWAINKHGINNISIKFTGGNGFHMGIPWESFPAEVNFEPISILFPTLPRIVADYLRSFTKDKLISNLESKWTWEEMAKESGLDIEKVKKDDDVNPWKIVDIDPILISPRHLFRMPYSINKKNMLISIPFDINVIDKFVIDWAKPANVKTDLEFLGSWEANEATLLFSKALEWWEKTNKPQDVPTGAVRDYNIKNPIPEMHFPPCVKNMLSGMADGRKRTMFILSSFLRSAKWEWEEIEDRLYKWNQLNKPPLPEIFIKTHVRNHRRKKDILPPNCDSGGWYQDMGVCTGDECGRYKNPTSFMIKSYFRSRKRKK